MRRSLALTGPELAKLAGVSEATWAVHKKKGAPVPRTKRELKAWVDLYRKWREETLMPGRGPGKKLENTPRREADLWSTRRQKYLALRQKQIYEVEKGLLVRREEVVQAFRTAIVNVKKRLVDARKKLPPLLFQAPSVEWIEERLGEEFDAICEAFAHGMSDGPERRESERQEEVEEEAEAGEAAAAPPAGPADPGRLEDEGEADG